MADQNQQQKQWAKIVAKAWADEDYKQRLLTSPADIMKEEGIELPEGVDLKCVEATPSQTWIVLPPNPMESDGIEEGEERLAALCSPFSSQCWMS